MVQNISKSLPVKGLKYKLRLVFYLMLVLPLLVFIYLISNFSLFDRETGSNIVVISIIGIFIWLAGFWIVHDIIKRIVNISFKAQKIVSGDVDQRIIPKEPDEIGDLGSAINLLTKQIRSNMDELKGYSRKTTEFNIEIQRRVVVLSSLLQITAMVSENCKLGEIMRVAVEKSRQIVDSDLAYLVLKEEGEDVFRVNIADGRLSRELLSTRFSAKENIFGKYMKEYSILVLDSENAVSDELRMSFREKFDLENSIAVPIYSKGAAIGVIGIGNKQSGFVYKKDDIDLLCLFAKNIAIAIDNEHLRQKVEVLEIEDALTGLYNEPFIRGRLEEEIKRSMVYQRPCAFVLFKIVDYKKLCDEQGSRFGEGILKRIAVIIKDSVSEIDHVARFGDDAFAILFPEKNKRRAMQIAEAIVEKIEYSFKEDNLQQKILINGSLSENPLDGVSAKELIQKANDLLAKAMNIGGSVVISE